MDDSLILTTVITFMILSLINACFVGLDLSSLAISYILLCVAGFLFIIFMWKVMYV